MSAEVLHGLANDLVQGQYADKERAVAMLSSMTMYIDHHDVLLESGVLPALMSAVSNPKVEPTVNLAVASAIDAVTWFILHWHTMSIQQLCVLLSVHARQCARVHLVCAAMHSCSCPYLCTDRSVPLNCVQVHVWSAWYSTWLLMQLTPKGVDFSFRFYRCVWWLWDAQQTSSRAQMHRTTSPHIQTSCKS